MHMVRHDLQSQDLCLMLLAHLTNDGGEPSSYIFSKDLAPVLGTPDHMVLTGIEHIPVGLGDNLAH
jgi:hypothetical protein